MSSRELGAVRERDSAAELHGGFWDGRGGGRVGGGGVATAAAAGAARHDGAAGLSAGGGHGHFWRSGRRKRIDF